MWASSLAKALALVVARWRSVAPVIVALALVLSACGGGQTYGDPFAVGLGQAGDSELSKFIEAWRPAVPAEDPPVAVGVVDDDTLLGRDFETGTSWQFRHRLEAQPVLAGAVVIGMGAGEIFALEARTGRLLWSRQAFGRLQGAADDGKTTILSLRSLSRGRNTVLAVARDGVVVRQLETQRELGSAAILDGVVFLPYGGNQVVVFDLIEGIERARVVSTEAVRFARFIDGALFFGDRSVTRFDERVLEARRGGGTRMEFPQTSLVEDQVAWPSREPSSDKRRAFVRSYARPDLRPMASGWASYGLSFYELAVGLSAETGTPRWVHLGTAPFLAGSATEDGLALCDRDGMVRWLAGPAGEIVLEGSLGRRLIACAVQGRVGRLPDGPPARSGPLLSQLSEALCLERSHLLPIQLGFIGVLASLGGEQAAVQLRAVANGSACQRKGIAREVEHPLRREAQRFVRRRSPTSSGGQQSLAPLDRAD